MRPDMALKVVLFPAPLGPIMLVIAPAGTSSDARWTASIWPYFIVTSCRLSRWLVTRRSRDKPPRRAAHDARHLEPLRQSWYRSRARSVDRPDPLPTPCRAQRAELPIPPRAIG